MLAETGEFDIRITPGTWPIIFNVLQICYVGRNNESISRVSQTLWLTWCCYDSEVLLILTMQMIKIFLKRP